MRNGSIPDARVLLQKRSWEDLLGNLDAISGAVRLPVEAKEWRGPHLRYSHVSRAGPSAKEHIP